MATFYVDGTVAASGNGQTKETAFKTIGEGLDAWAVQYHYFFIQGMDAEPQYLYVRALDADGREIVYSTEHGNSDAVAVIPNPETDPSGRSFIQGYASVPGDLGAPIVIDCQSSLSYGIAGTNWLSLDLYPVLVRNAATVPYHFTSGFSLAAYGLQAENAGTGGFYVDDGELTGGLFVNTGAVCAPRMRNVRLINPIQIDPATGGYLVGDMQNCIALGCRGACNGLSGGMGGSIRNSTVQSADGLGTNGATGWDAFNNVIVGYKRPMWLMGAAGGNLYTTGQLTPNIPKNLGNTEVAAIALADADQGDARVVSPSLYKNGIPIGWFGTLPGAGGELCIGQALVNMGARR